VSVRIPAGYRIRPFRPDDADTLYDVEGAATGLLIGAGYPQFLEGQAPPRADFAKVLAGRTVFVAAGIGDDTPIGYAALGDIEGAAYLNQLSVLPAQGRKGIGSALLEAALGHARWQFAPIMALSTFRDVPFNAPFYAKRGFVAVDPATADPALLRQFQAEIPDGIAP